MNKSAKLNSNNVSESVGSNLTSLIPFVGSPINAYSFLAGLIRNEDNSQKGMWSSLIPGVGAYRQGNRIKTQVTRELRDIESDPGNKGSRPVGHAVSEFIGPGTSIAASTGLGAALGALINKKDKVRGAATGAAIGLGASSTATLAGAILAAISRRRTKQEQIDNDKGSIAARYLVPGVAAYDRYKRLGRSQGEKDEDPNNKTKKNNKKIKKEACTMTTQEAYAEGFCKAAEANGVDPQELYKFAFEFNFGKKEKKPDHSFGNMLTSLVGGTTSTAASALAGTGVGALVSALSKGRINPAKAKEIGTGIGLAGGIGGNLLGTVSPLFTKRRTRAEQSRHDSEGHKLKNLLIPGHANYNFWKRIGRIIGNASGD